MVILAIPVVHRTINCHMTGIVCHPRASTYYCVDHTILQQRLQIGAGLTDVVLEWIVSFLSERTQQIAYGGELSSIQLVLFGVPQGSVLGPVLCILYTAELFDVVARHRLHLHMYADDSQVYTSVRQPTTPPPPLSASLRALPTSTTG